MNTPIFQDEFVPDIPEKVPFYKKLSPKAQKVAKIFLILLFGICLCLYCSIFFQEYKYYHNQPVYHSATDYASIYASDDYFIFVSSPQDKSFTLEFHHSHSGDLYTYQLDYWETEHIFYPYELILQDISSENEVILFQGYYDPNSFIPLVAYEGMEEVFPIYAWFAPVYTTGILINDAPSVFSALNLALGENALRGNVEYLLFLLIITVIWFVEWRYPHFMFRIQTMFHSDNAEPNDFYLMMRHFSLMVVYPLLALWLAIASIMV